MRTHHFSEAFSLLELIIVVVIVALVVAIGIPGITQARTNAEIETMRTRAVALQNAKTSYISAVGTQAASVAWNAASNNTDPLKYSNILLPYLPPTAANGLSVYIPTPYTVGLNNLGGAVLFYTVKGGNVQPLQKY